MTTLGTDGFGRSDGRRALRDFFEGDARHIAVAALSALRREGTIDVAVVEHALRDLSIDPERSSSLLR